MSKVRNLPQKSSLNPNDLFYVIDSAVGVNGGSKMLFSTLRTAALPTATEAKALYESNADTNAYTNAEKTKLAGIAAGATVDQIASTVPYTNTASGLVSTNVQSAIDELATEASLKPSKDGSLILSYSAGNVRFDNTFYALSAGAILLNANVTDGYVYVDIDGDVTQTASGVLPPPYTVVIAKFSTNGTNIVSLTDQRVSTAQNIIRGLVGDITDVNAGDSYLAGSTDRVADAGHQHEVVTGAPADQSADAMAAEGTGIALARADHIHHIPTAIPVAIGSANSQGASSAFAKADHVHQGVHSLKVNSGTTRYGDLNLKSGIGASVSDDGAGNFTVETNGGPNELSVSAGIGLTINYTGGKVRFEGTFTSIASSVLALPQNQTGVVYVDVDSTIKFISGSSAPAGTIGLASVTTNVSSVTSVTDRRVFLQKSSIAGAAVTLNPDQTNGAGASNSYARADHIHNIPTAAPINTGAANVQGSSTSFARADHQHNTVLSNMEAQETADITTLSTTDTQMGNMTLTPAAGTWLILFSTSVNNSANGTTRNFVNLYSGSSVIPGTERNTGSTSDAPVSTQAVVTLDGITAISAKWRVVGGTGTAHSRRLTAVRIG